MGKIVTDKRVVEIETLGIVTMKTKIIDGLIMEIRITDPNAKSLNFCLPHDHSIRSLKEFRVQIGDMIAYCLKYLKEADHDPI